MSTKIGRLDISDRLDQHFTVDLDCDKYNLLYVEAASLITCNRLDLAFKILYLRTKGFADNGFAQELYLNHIKALSLGSFKEPGNDNKNSAQKYLDEFENIFQSIKRNGVDEKKSIVPLSKNGGIANGAHRVASAFVLNKTLPAVQLGTPDHNYNYDFFLQRGMGRRDVETAVKSFIDIANNSYVALLWPSAKGKHGELQRIIPNIIYENSYSLNHNGAHNLLAQVYYKEAWLGSRENNFIGAKNKLVKCFSNSGSIRVIAFQAESLDKVLSIKDEIRSLFGIGKHSVHISDTQAEAIRISRALFNQNSIHFLNYGNPNKYLSTIGKINKFKSFLKDNEVDLASAIIDSSMLLSLYGLRESNDIDYISIGSDIKFLTPGIECHIDELKYHEEKASSLVLNDHYYFYYEDLKFISFSQLHRMKSNRAESKDLNDILLMNALLESNLLAISIAQTKQKFLFMKTKFKLELMEVLRSLGLYYFVRSIYRFIGRK